MTNPCPDFAERLEQCVRGIRTDGVEGHLSSCAPCRSYLSQAQAIDEQLKATLAEPISPPVWAAVEQRIRLESSTRRLVRWTAVLMACLGLGAAALSWLADLDPAVPIATLLISAMLAFAFRLDQNAFARAQSRNEDLFAWARRAVRKELRTAYAGGTLFSFCAISVPMVGAMDPADDLQWVWAVMSGALLVCVGLIIRRTLSLRRELKVIA